MAAGVAPPPHDSGVHVVARRPARILASLAPAPVIAGAESEDILNHHQAPLLDGDDVFLAAPSGRRPAGDPAGSRLPAPCGSARGETPARTETRHVREGGALAEKRRLRSHDKPVPDAGARLGPEPASRAAPASGSPVAPGAIPARRGRTRSPPRDRCFAAPPSSAPTTPGMSMFSAPGWCASERRSRGPVTADFHPRR